MTEYAPETKAQVIADAQLGMSKSAIARKYSVPRTTVIDWVTRHEPPIPTVTDSEKREDLGRLVFEYLVAGLQALKAQAEQSADPTYLRGQRADNLSLLHGVMADKLIAVLQGVEPVSEGASD